MSVEIRTKRSTPNAVGGIGNHPGPVDVVVHRLGRIDFEHRHVLVGRGMEHDIRFELPEHPVHPVPVLDVAQDRLQLQPREMASAVHARWRTDCSPRAHR